jgi:hypothetical protein
LNFLHKTPFYSTNMEFTTNSPLISFQHVCTQVSPLSSHVSHGVYASANGAHIGTAANGSFATVHPKVLEPTVDPRARASVSDCNKFSHAYPPGRPPSTDYAIKIAQPDPYESQRALMEKLAELDGNLKTAPTTLTIQPPETVEKLISMWRLPRTTAQPITQIILNPPSQQRATDTDRFLQSGAASTITYGTPPQKT